MGLAKLQWIPQAPRRARTADPDASATPTLPTPAVTSETSDPQTAFHPLLDSAHMSMDY